VEHNLGGEMDRFEWGRFVEHIIGGEMVCFKWGRSWNIS
jgi:hypothetical protein